MAVHTEALSRRAHAWMGVLAREGVRPGDIVAVEARPDERSVVHLMALWAFGAVAFPIPLRYPRETWPRWARVAGACWAVDGVVAGVPALPPARELGEGMPALPCPPPATPGGVRLLTSGSTGTPKAVHVDWSALWHSATGVSAHLNLHDAHAWLMALPLYHVGGLGVVVRTWMQGASLVFAREMEGLPDTLARARPTHLSLVPTQLRRLLDAPNLLTHTEAVFLGGSAVEGALIDRAVGSGIPLYTSYGLSEMASTVTLTPPGASADVLRSAGRLLPGREMQVVQGELFVRGQTLFAGYVAEGEIHPAVTPEGWFPTGDLGHQDERGMWHILGRKDAMFISGGENIHPEALEAVLRTLLGIEDAIVVPVEDAEFGHRPFAFLAGSVSIPLDELRKHLDGHLPRFMHPVGVAPMPPVAGLKPSRAHLKALAQASR